MFRITFSMPQLDALTYFSQFIYLLISFAAVYALTLNTILPSVVSATKLRQKLNSIARVGGKLAFSNAPDNASLSAQYDSLLSSNWYAGAKMSKSWPNCARMLQMGQTLRLKKLFCSFNVKPFQLVSFDSK